MCRPGSQELRETLPLQKRSLLSPKRDTRVLLGSCSRSQSTPQGFAAGADTLVVGDVCQRSRVQTWWTRCGVGVQAHSLSVQRRRKCRIGVSEIPAEATGRRWGGGEARPTHWEGLWSHPALPGRS